jgi:hypothetical protein
MVVRKVLHYVTDTPFGNLIDTLNHETALCICYDERKYCYEFLNKHRIAIVFLGTAIPI